MKDLDKHTRQLSNMGAIRPQTDPLIKEDTCPLCGRYMPLYASGNCDTEECTENARDKIRKIARKAGKDIIPGLYMRIPGHEIFVFTGLKQWKEPIPPSEYSPDEVLADPDKCTYAQCERIARPNDTLCVVHRIEVTQARHKERSKADRRRFERPTVERRKTPGLKGRIKGLDKIKL